MVFPVGIPVVVFSGSHSSDHHHQRVQQVAAVDVEESPAALQLHRRRSAKYQPTTWDYDSICSLLSRRPLPLPLGGSQQDEAAAAADAIANHLQLVRTSIAFAATLLYISGGKFLYCT
jgi:hypothetical protein